MSKQESGEHTKVNKAAVFLCILYPDEQLVRIWWIILILPLSLSCPIPCLAHLAVEIILK